MLVNNKHLQYPHLTKREKLWLLLHDSVTNSCLEPSESSRHLPTTFLWNTFSHLLPSMSVPLKLCPFPQVCLPKFPMDISRLPHASHSQPFRCHLPSNAVTELLGMYYATVPSYLPSGTNIHLNAWKASNPCSSLSLWDNFHTFTKQGVKSQF